MTKRIGVDILLWIISLVCCLIWRFAADKSEVWAYIVLAAILMASWIAVGLLVQALPQLPQGLVLAVDAIAGRDDGCADAGCILPAA